MTMSEDISAILNGLGDYASHLDTLATMSPERVTAELARRQSEPRTYLPEPTPTYLEQESKFSQMCAAESRGDMESARMHGISLGMYHRE